MKAPDKIYARITAGDLDARLTPGTMFGEPYPEYIRKDSLIEKLEKTAASYKKRSDEGELVWQNMCGINEAINILNEM